MEQQRLTHAAHFAERLLALQPASVLDIGCGLGGLLLSCKEAGIPCAGVEPGAERAAAARAAGLDVRCAAGQPLAFDDSAFDWVTLRHVPHHLEQPRAVFAEAWRVARTGVLIAEPWFDDSLPSQRAARRADELSKRLDRARGMFHADVLDAANLIDLLPAEAEIEIAPFLRLRPWHSADLSRELEQAAGDESVNGAERALWTELCELARKGHMTLNGTLLVCARKPV